MGNRFASSLIRHRRAFSRCQCRTGLGGRGSYIPALVLLIILVAFAVRVYRLDAVGLDGDEAFSIRAGHQSFAQIVQLVTTTEPPPPLYYTFLRVWHPLAGMSEFALRFPSVVAGVLTIALIVRVAGLFSWRAAGLVAALLLTFNPYQVWYAQEARMYSLLALFGLAAVFFALRFLMRIPDRERGVPGRGAEKGTDASRDVAAVERRRVGRLPNLWLYVAAMLLAIYSHYYGFFLFVSINLLAFPWLWSQKRLRADFIRWAGAQIAVVALFAPWLVVAQNIVADYRDFAPGSLDFAAILRESVRHYSLGVAPMAETAFGVALGFLVIALAGLLIAGRIGAFPAWFRVAFLGGYLLMPIGLGLLFSQVKVMFATRYFMISAPAFYLALGLGVVGLYARIRLVGVAAGLFLVGAQIVPLNAYFHDQSYVKSDFREAATYVREHARPGDAIIVDGWSQTYQFWYYYTMKTPRPVSSYVFPPNVPDRWASAGRDLDHIMARHQGVWLLDYDFLAYDPQHVVETHLAQNYYPALVHRVGVDRVAYYASAPPSASDPVPLDVDFGRELLLKDVTIGEPAARRGDVVHLALRWHALKDIGHDYAVSWRMLDPQGHVVLQRDAEPAAGFQPTGAWNPGEKVVDRYGLPIPTYLPPGEYTLSVVVYDKRSGAVLRPHRGDEVWRGHAITLGRIRVLDVPPVAAIDEAAPSHTAQASLGAVSLIGFDLGKGPYRPGDTISVRLFWRATPRVDRAYRAVIRLLSAAGEPIRESSISLGFPGYADGSPAGQVIATYADIPVPARASGGAHRLALSIEADGLGESRFAGFPSVPIVARERSFTAPAIRHRKTANFGGLIELLGYDLPPDAAAAVASGRAMPVTLYWRAMREMAESYKVFVHLVGQDGQIYAQHDSSPLDGKAPTAGWVPGEVLRDRYDLHMSRRAPGGHYRVKVGLYREENGHRIKMADGSGDSFALTDIVVEPREAPGQQ